MKRNQDTHATPGLTANKRLTMDLLYKKGTMDRDDQANETTVAEESPSKQEEQNKTKCPPPKLPDLSYDDGDTPTSPPPFQKQPPAVGAVHSLAEKFGPNTSPQKAVQPAEPEPQPDDDDNSQNNVFAAALRSVSDSRSFAVKAFFNFVFLAKHVRAWTKRLPPNNR